MALTIGSMGIDPNNGATDLILGIGALLALISLVRSWRSLVDDDFTSADRHVAMQVSVFLIPPVVVLLHELAHAAATVSAGGTVTNFHYGLFEGAVSFTGQLTNGQVWFIALAGNLVSIGMGLAMVAAGGLAGRLRRPLRYILIVGGLIEAVFGLIGYPLLSESGRFGDWLLIYDFGANPGLSWATLVVHVAVVVGLWQWWRTSLRRTLFAVTYGEEDRLRRLSAAVTSAPAELEPRLALANLFAGHGDLKLADATLRDAVPTTADPARLQLARARLAIHESKWTQALLATQAGLSAIDAAGAELTGGYAIAQQLWANQGVALTQLGRSALALAAFAHVDEPLMADARVRYCRGLARLDSGDVAGGRGDLAAVVGGVRGAGGVPDNLLARWAEARLAGRDPEPPDDSDRPAWARRRQSPPAPITGV
ncbi:MAG: [ribosomal protein S5]-alanine N-acetyltransferase [Acidimicrobiaceae bacterium]